jgi:hypothetical protein
VVIAAVVLLIVIAVAGIVLAGRYNAPATSRAPSAPAAPVASTQPDPAAPTSTPNEVLFAAGSDRLAVPASESIARFSENARSAGGMVRMTARYATGENKTKDVALAKSRTAAVRHALQANGVKAETMQVELIEMPASAMNDKDANRVDLSLH